MRWCRARPTLVCAQTHVLMPTPKCQVHNRDALTRGSTPAVSFKASYANERVKRYETTE
jgi:hypothetical protein